MNHISFTLETNRFLGEGIPSITIDGERLAILAGSFAPTAHYAELVAVLLPLEMSALSPSERRAARARLLPSSGETTVAPILMCPDDLDFSCTVVVVEVQHQDRMVRWLRLGAEGGDAGIEWWPRFQPLAFDVDDYVRCLDGFDSITVS